MKKYDLKCNLVVSSFRSINSEESEAFTYNINSHTINYHCRRYDKSNRIVAV